MINEGDILNLTGGNLPKYIQTYKDFTPGRDTVYYSGPYWDHKELTVAVSSLLEGKWITSGIEVAKFQSKFSRKFNVKWSHMVNSGSSANLVMITALKKFFNWKDNDGIIVSPVGFATTIAPIVQNNLKPIFVDIEWPSLNFDLDEVEIALKTKKNIKAIFVSPVLGNPPDMDRLKEMSQKYKVLLIGDNCDSLGSKWNGSYLTDFYFSWSSSFYPAHHISTGEGGMISSNDGEFVALCRSISWWGRDCHPAGTSIYINKGVKNIEDIKIGDEVYTHEGNYKRVYDLIQKKYTGELYTIKSKRNEEIKLTKNHPLYVRRGDDYSWILGKDLKIGDFLVQKVPTNIETPKSLSIEYETMMGDKTFYFEAEPDLFRLIGYWLAEGSTFSGNKGSNGKDRNIQKGKYKGYRVEFAFNENEIEYIDDVSILMKKYFGVSANIRNSKNSKGVSVNFKTRKAYEFFIKYCNKISFNKIIPGEFLHYDNMLLKELIKGFWRGDGSHDFQSVSLSSSSKNLINQFRMILSKFGISPSLLIRTPDKHTNSIVNNKSIEAKHNQYSLVSYGDNAKKWSLMMNEDWKEKEKRKNNTQYFSHDGKYVLHEIENIDIENVIDLDVYNFEVEDDHSYHANGIVSHNCYCVGQNNLLQNGTCGKRFQKWLPEYNGIVDHKYVFSSMGYNLKPLELQGAIGQIQLDKFDEMEVKRYIHKREVHEILEHYIDCIRVIKPVSSLSQPSWFGVPIVCVNQDLKDRLVEFFEENKIQTRNYFAGNILQHEGYKHLGDHRDFPNANETLSHVFFLGCSPTWNSKVISYITEVCQKWVN